MAEGTHLPSLGELRDGLPARRVTLDVEAPGDYFSERILLSAVMADAEVAREVVAEVAPGDFEMPQHGLVYDAVVAVTERGDAPSAVAVADELEERGVLGEVGDIGDLFALAGEGPRNAAEWRAAARRVLEKAHRRRLAERCVSIARMALDERVSPEDLLETGQRRLLADLDALHHDRQVSWEDCTLLGRAEILAGNDSDGRVTGLPFGLPSLDRLLLGAHPGEYVCIGARPAVGKTSFAMALAAHMARDPEVGVLYFSLEMDGTSLAKKMLLRRMGMSERDTLAGGLDRGRGEGRRRLEEAAAEVAPLNLEVMDDFGMSLAQLSATARRFFSNFERGAVFVDYLQLLSLSSGAHPQNRNVEVGEISRCLKRLATDLRVPVFVLSQLNRQVTSRLDRRPCTSDLRDSGSIEQDADRILLLDRSITEEEVMQEGRPPMNEFRVDVAKNRQGTGEGMVRLWYDPRGMRFADSSEAAARGDWI